MLVELSVMEHRYRAVLGVQVGEFSKLPCHHTWPENLDAFSELV
ncbi:hypothetical protein [Planosporangium mesophilum]|nr:hypothetical protein [Planosporangium mesophilum]